MFCGCCRRERRRPEPLRRPGEAGARWPRGSRSRSRATGARRRACRTRRAGTTCTAISGATTPSSPTTTPSRRTAARLARRRAHAADMQVAAVRMRLAAVLPAVRPEPARHVGEADADGAKSDEASRARGSLRAQAEVRRRGPGRAGELAARVVHLARQRADVEREGPRVLPASTISARTTTPSPGGRARTAVEDGQLARAGAAREDGPRRRPELPDGHVGALLRHRPAGGDAGTRRPTSTRTDMHSFIHPLSAAVPPCWESKSDWDIFKALAKKVSELAPDATSRSRCATS